MLEGGVRPPAAQLEKSRAAALTLVPHYRSLSSYCSAGHLTREGAEPGDHLDSTKEAGTAHPTRVHSVPRQRGGPQSADNCSPLQEKCPNPIL